MSLQWEPVVDRRHSVQQKRARLDPRVRQTTKEATLTEACSNPESNSSEGNVSDVVVSSSITGQPSSPPPLPGTHTPRTDASTGTDDIDTTKVSAAISNQHSISNSTQTSDIAAVAAQKSDGTSSKASLQQWMPPVPPSMTQSADYPMPLLHNLLHAWYSSGYAAGYYEVCRSGHFT